MLRRAPGSARTAVSLFTLLPVRGPAQLTRPAAARALLWLPAVGALLALLAGAALMLVDAAVPGPLGSLLAAVVAVALLAALTGGLHVDGLADTADALASRKPPGAALEIMRRPEVGPLGAAALLFTVLAQVTALATLGPGLGAAWILLVAAVGARAAVVLAARTPVPAARAEGLGALVAGSVGARAAGVLVVTVFLAVVASALPVGGLAAIRAGVVALLAGLLAGYGIRREALRRLGGVTGDVFGAIIEVSTAAALLAAAIVT